METKKHIFSSSTIKDLVKRSNSLSNVRISSQQILRRMNRINMQNRIRRRLRRSDNMNGLDRSECRKLKKMRVGKTGRSCAICYTDFIKGKNLFKKRSNYCKITLQTYIPSKMLKKMV